LIELGLNGLHVEKGAPKLHHLFAVRRGDQFKLGKTGQPELRDFLHAVRNRAVQAV
jgi:hypothetical protein